MILDMNKNNCSKSSHRKRDIKNGIILSKENDNVVIVASKSLNVEIHKPQKNSEISAQIKKETDKLTIVQSLEEVESKSLLKFSVTMNNCIDNTNCDMLSVDDMSSSVCRTSSYSSDINDTIKSDKASCSKICNSCKNNVINCKTREGQFHVSIKSDKPLHCCKGHKIELNCDIPCRDRYLGKHAQHTNGSLSLANESKPFKLDVLLEFLNQMRVMVESQELSFRTFRSVTQRLVKDKKFIELLLLIEIIIRAQVVQMSRLISLDLFRQKITPAVFVISFLKQYQFLKSLSLVYKEILNDYESSYLSSRNLSFDLISRTYFKLIISDCPRIKEQIESGYLNIKIDKLCDSSMTKDQREQIRTNYAALKSDFQDTNKWKDIDQIMRHILNNPDNTVKSLVNYFNNNFTLYFPSKFQFTKNVCDSLGKSVTYQSDVSYKDLLRTLPNLPEIDIDIPPSWEYHLELHNNIDQKVESSESKSKTQNGSVRSHHSPIYQAYENIKPGSSSSNNSNGYSSCLSISSNEENIDDEVDSQNKEKKSFQKWKPIHSIVDGSPYENIKLSTPVSLNGDQDIELTNYGHPISHKRCIFRDKCQNGDQDEIQTFNKFCKHYRTENGHLLENRSSASEHLNKFEKVSCHPTTFDCSHPDPYHSHLSPKDGIRHSDTCCSKHRHHTLKEKDFEIDFEELLKAFGVDTSTRKNLEEFQKFLKNKLKTDKGKIRPNLEALVQNCRIYCKKLYNTADKEDNLKSTESVTMETTKKDTFVPTKQVACYDESFDIPFDGSSTVKTDVCSKHRHCLNNSNNSNNTSIDINISSSDICTYAEHSSNNKVCNCCKCEMFGEQSLASNCRNSNVTEKLRIALQKRKQSQLKCQLNCRQNGHSGVSATDQLPDVDTLVKFINGTGKTNYSLSQTPDTVYSLRKKSKHKSNKAKTRKIMKSVILVPEIPITPKEEISESVNCDKELNGTVHLPIISNVTEKPRKHKKELSKSKVSKQNGLNTSNNKVAEKEVYDPVVEDFKRFCSNVVVPKNRKKLPIDASLLIGEVGKRQMNINGNLI